MPSKNSPRPEGLITALVTPFNNGAVDYRSVKKLLKHQLDNGIQGFVINGTTGESPTLEWQEVERLFLFVKAEVAGAVPLILGTGTNATSNTIVNTMSAKKLKADAALVVCPYYNKPTQEGLFQHYSAIAKRVSLPIIMYNVPGRTVVSINTNITERLSKTKNICGIKDASGDLKSLKFLKTKVTKNFLLLSGDDSTCVDFMLAGGHGVISVVSHIIPAEIRRFADLARAGDKAARVSFARYNDLIKVLNIDPNPMPVKMMLYLMGIIKSPELRLPLITAGGRNKTEMAKVLKKLGLI